jgi:hypothetical protein
MYAVFVPVSVSLEIVFEYLECLRTVLRFAVELQSVEKYRKCRIHLTPPEGPQGLGAYRRG